MEKSEESRGMGRGEKAEISVVEEEEKRRRITFDENNGNSTHDLSRSEAMAARGHGSAV